MTIAYIPLLAVSLIVSFVFCFKRRNGFGVNTLLLKVVSSLCFLLCGVAAIMISGSTIYGGLILFGGVLGLCGDAFLDMKGIYSESKIKYMYGGFIAFLVGHIFYIAAMLIANQLKFVHILICVGISVVVAAINVLGEKVMKLEYGCFKTIMFVYGFILLMTLTVSAMCLIVNGFSVSRLLMLLGAIFFALSDIILNNTYFGKGFDGPIWYFSNHLTYYIGQYLIMTSILTI